MSIIKKIKEVHLIYENCDASTIFIKDIDYLYVGKVYKYIDNWNAGELNLENYYTNDFHIVFKDLNNLEYVSNFSSGSKKESILKRLQLCPDITHINIIFKDKTSIYINIPWGSKDNFYNAFQILGIKKDNLYFIDICKKWTIKKLYRYILHEFKCVVYRIKRKLMEATA